MVPAAVKNWLFTTGMSRPLSSSQLCLKIGDKHNSVDGSMSCMFRGQHWSKWAVFLWIMMVSAFWISVRMGGNWLWSHTLLYHTISSLVCLWLLEVQCVIEFGEEIWIAEMTTMFNSAFLNGKVLSSTACVCETTYSNQFRVQSSHVLSEQDNTLKWARDLLTIQVTSWAKSVLWEPTGWKNLFEKNCHPTAFGIKLLGNLSIFHANKFQLMNPDQANFVSAEKLLFFSFLAALCCKHADSSPSLLLVHLIWEESAMLRR